MKAMLPARVTSFALVALLATAACGDDDPAGPSIPAAPTGVTASAQSSTSIRVTWTASTGATSYIVQRASGTGAFAEVGTPTVTSFDDTGLNPSTQYRYRVSARNGAGSSSFSADANVNTSDPPTVEVTTNVTANTTWTRGNTYLLKGFIRVADGATLTIESGTTIKGDFNTPRTALVILRGGRIVANGTAAQPIVFTSSRNPNERQAGDWGGLAIVGRAPINRTGQVILEGTDQSAGGAIEYSGGSAPADNSGTLRYVRVEFAGYELSPANELNAFTFAAVGSGTTIEYLQAINGLDDHFEWFGGTVDAKYLVSYEAGDDHFDMSEGFQGRLQFLIAYQSKVLVPRPGAGSVSTDPQGIENDGCAGAGCTTGTLGEASTPFTQPLVANFTLVGRGTAEATTREIGMVLRRGTAGYYINGHVTRWPNFGIGVRESTNSTAQADRIADGSFLLQNILVTDGAAVFETGTGRLNVALGAPNNLVLATATTTQSLFAAYSTDPSSASQLDWSPAASAVQATGGTGALAGAIATKAGAFVTGTAYRGAADPAGAKWWQGWTVYFDN